MYSVAMGKRPAGTKRSVRVSSHVQRPAGCGVRRAGGSRASVPATVVSATIGWLNVIVRWGANGVSPVGTILTTSSDRTGRLWDAKTGALLHTLPGHGRPVMSGAFSPDGKLAVTASHDKNARIWNVATGALLATLPTDGSEVQTAVFSPDGTRLLTATFDGVARIWDVSAYKPR